MYRSDEPKYLGKDAALYYLLITDSEDDSSSSSSAEEPEPELKHNIRFRGRRYVMN